MVRTTKISILRFISLTLLVSVFSIACLANDELRQLELMSPTYTPAPARIIEVTSTPGPWLCLKGKFQISDEAGGQWIIGEKLLCAPEWKISNMYGPDFSSIKDKPIHFSDFIPQE